MPVCNIGQLLAVRGDYGCSVVRDILAGFKKQLIRTRNFSGQTPISGALHAIILLAIDTAACNPNAAPSGTA
jgi:hypothetical protein